MRKSGAGRTFHARPKPRVRSRYGWTIDSDGTSKCSCVCGAVVTCSSETKLRSRVPSRSERNFGNTVTMRSGATTPSRVRPYPRALQDNHPLYQTEPVPGSQAPQQNTSNGQATGCAVGMGRKMKSGRRSQNSCTMALNPSSSVLMGSSSDGVSQAPSNVQNGSQPECAGCQKPIRERYLLRALDQLWHEDCLKCACCDCRLGEVGSTLFHKANLILCKRDYLRLFGVTGLCSACHKQIPAFEMVMRARGNVYHLECFACQQCNHRFCVGDRFYLHENRILCEYDYEERMVFSQMGGQYPIQGAAPPMQQHPPHHHHHQQQPQQQPGSPYSMNGTHTPTHHPHQGSSMMPLTPPQQQQSLDRSPLTTAHHKQRTNQQQGNPQAPSQGQTGTPGAPTQPEGDILFDVTSNGSTVAGTPQGSQNPGSNSGK